ncbi:TetR/AcrR family transcriptional regulator [Paramicrobacterium agarici]|uniref:TetR/AcrR family transcriptional regulator n=1 Tax=Paramicrobacterium agarici TaxID=630514 RepID=UPI00114DDEF1|nr:TetR/AcrR family transcriptional regulator [Microbacterium agarici]TQO23722.1 TetR family transcriptional regulator [Microbacterium agarici]
MPRITSEQRSSNRDQIIAAARRCFARQGFHSTSMPDIAAEAGFSTGAPYRYFTGKQELIVEVATRAFAAVFDPVLRIIEESEAITIGDLLTAAVQSHPPTGSADSTDDRVASEELLRCGIAAWAELLHNTDLHEHAVTGFNRITGDIARALHGTQDADGEANARVIVALLHGFMIQRVAFGLTDLESLDHNIRAAMTRIGIISDKTL